MRVSVRMPVCLRMCVHVSVCTCERARLCMCLCVRVPAWTSLQACVCAHTCACVLGGDVLTLVLPQLMTETLVLIQGRSKGLFGIIILNILSTFFVEISPGGKLKVRNNPKQSYFASLLRAWPLPPMIPSFPGVLPGEMFLVAVPLAALGGCHSSPTVPTVLSGT